ncbi:MAG: alcohol dehydrogenase catalytic domain-containing protein, partial [Acidimicrobiales bacterium]
MSAVALNPLDLAVASGRFYGGSPPLPYVPGLDGIGRVVGGALLPPGTRVYLRGAGLGLVRDGTLAQLVAVPGEAVLAIPERVEDAQAAALGVAGLAGWLPLSWRAPVRPGECVL